MRDRFAVYVLYDYETFWVWMLTSCSECSPFLDCWCKRVVEKIAKNHLHLQVRRKHLVSNHRRKSQEKGIKNIWSELGWCIGNNGSISCRRSCLHWMKKTSKFSKNYFLGTFAIWRSKHQHLNSIGISPFFHIVNKCTL